MQKEYLRYRDLYGARSTRHDIKRELSRLPVDQVLGIINKFTMMTLQKENHGMADIHRLMEGYLARRYIPLPRHRHLLDPDRPMVHGHNVAWLSHQALQHCKLGTTSPDFTDRQMAQVLVLLLQASDHLNSDHRHIWPPIGFLNPKDKGKLLDQKQMMLSRLRVWQFQYREEAIYEYARLSRAYVLYKKAFQSTAGTHLETIFQHQTDLTLQEYFQGFGSFMAWVLQDLKKTSDLSWFGLDTFTRNMKANQDVFHRLVHHMSVTPEGYREKYVANRTAFPHLQEDFNFMVLKECPLIEARPGDFMVPSLPFLFEKIITVPYFAVLDGLPSKKTRDDYTSLLGTVFEEYAGGLVTSIATHMAGDPPAEHPNLFHLGRRDRELSDFVLVRDGKAITFEFKSLRMNKDFLSGLPNDLVVGPRDDVLRSLQRGEGPVNLKSGADRDQGMFTRSLVQQSSAAENLLDELNAQRHLGVGEVLPIIVHLADAKVDEVMYQGYLTSYMELAGLYALPEYQRPLFVSIEDLEFLCGWVEQRKPDVWERLFAKQPELRMDLFIFEQAKTLHWVPEVLREAFSEILGGARAAFFEQP